MMMNIHSLYLFWKAYDPKNWTNVQFQGNNLTVTNVLLQVFLDVTEWLPWYWKKCQKMLKKKNILALKCRLKRSLLFYVHLNVICWVAKWHSRDFFNFIRVIRKAFGATFGGVVYFLCFKLFICILSKTFHIW